MFALASRIISKRGFPLFHEVEESGLGAAEGITATAHKLARILYRLIKHGEEYVGQGIADYEEKHHQRQLKHLNKLAASMGYNLIQNHILTSPVS